VQFLPTIYCSIFEELVLIKTVNLSINQKLMQRNSSSSLENFEPSKDMFSPILLDVISLRFSMNFAVSVGIDQFLNQKYTNFQIDITVGALSISKFHNKKGS